MAGASEAEQALARRLRSLRERHWPDRRITQPQLAEAFGTDRPLSLSLISSWENIQRPVKPPIPRLRQYAGFFATRRSVSGQRPRLLTDSELTQAEKVEREKLYGELLRLRDAEDAAGAEPAPASRQPLAPAGDMIGGGPYHFADRRPVTIVCARLPGRMLEKMPYTDIKDPDYVRSYSYADIDALIEMFGHIRAVNPTVPVNIRTADDLDTDDYTTHLVLLGGVDWNPFTEEIVNLVRLPLLPGPRTEENCYGYFEVVSNGATGERIKPVLVEENGVPVLREDLAHVFRSANPFNIRRTLTLCCGMFGRGTFGAVRALTDVRFRDRNERFLRDRFGGFERFSVLARVRVTTNGDAVTPDWTIPTTVLHEWPPPDDGL
jgi:transcriptional regulator with XRE-family HTH domain